MKIRGNIKKQVRWAVERPGRNPVHEGALVKGRCLYDNLIDGCYLVPVKVWQYLHSPTSCSDYFYLGGKENIKHDNYLL